MLLLVGWPWLLLAGLLAGAMGLALGGRWRRWLLALAALLLTAGTLTGFAAFDHKISRTHEDATEQAHERELHETLTAPRQVLDSSLSAGTVVYWTDEARVEFRNLVLPAPAKVFGLVLSGSLDDDFQLTRWVGTLAEDQSVAGWPCRKGDVAFDYDRHLLSCVLAADHAAFGFVLPAGTLLSFTPEYDGHDFTLPADRTMLVPSLGVAAPASTHFAIKHQSPETMRLPDEASLTLRGLTLAGEGTWHYPGADEDVAGSATTLPADHFDGALAAAFVCAGHSFPAESKVAMGLANGNVTLEDPQTGGNPVDLTSCTRKSAGAEDAREMTTCRSGLRRC